MKCYVTSSIVLAEQKVTFYLETRHWEPVLSQRNKMTKFATNLEKKCTCSMQPVYRFIFGQVDSGTFRIMATENNGSCELKASNCKYWLSINKL